MRCDEAMDRIAWEDLPSGELESHLRTCESCSKARAIVTLARSERAPDLSYCEPPRVEELERALRARTRRRVVGTGALLLAASLLAFVALQGRFEGGEPDEVASLSTQEPDLLGALDSIDKSLFERASAEPPGLEGLALLDPYGEDWTPPYQVLTDSLQQQGDL